MDEKLILSNKKLSLQHIDEYSLRREQNKNGKFVAMIMFIKSAIGLGLLSNSYFFVQTGIILGSITTMLITFLIMYSLRVMLVIADKYELKNKGKEVENMDQVALDVFGKKMQILTKFLNFSFNFCCLVVNVTNFSKFIELQISEDTSWHQIKIWQVKLMILIFLLLCLLVIVEPEKLRYPSYFGVLVLFISLVIFWVLNISKIINAEKLPVVSLLNFKALDDFIGNQLYAMECIGTLFTVRSTLKKRKDMQQLLVISFLIILFLFLINGSTFIFSIDSNDIKEMPFENYPGNIIVLIFQCLFYLTLPATILIFIISNCYELENISSYKKLLVDKNEDIVIWKLILSRSILTCIMILPSFFLKDEFVLTVFSGIIVVPLIGFIIPLTIDFKMHYESSSKKKLFGKCLILVLAMILNGVCIYEINQKFQFKITMENQPEFYENYFPEYDEINLNLDDLILNIQNEIKENKPNEQNSQDAHSMYEQMISQISDEQIKITNDSLANQKEKDLMRVIEILESWNFKLIIDHKKINHRIKEDQEQKNPINQFLIQNYYQKQSK